MIDQLSLEKALRNFALNDQRLDEAIRLYGMPKVRRREPGFAGLLRIILAQQISVPAANAIEKRLHSHFSELTAEAISRADPEILRTCGLSRPKIGYAKGLAEAILSGTFLPQKFSDMSDGAVIEKISGLKGFGRWSAEIYCMFCLGREDIFPAEDLALQTAIARLYSLENRLAASETRSLAEKWMPLRSAAATFLWHYYRGNPA